MAMPHVADLGATASQLLIQCREGEDRRPRPRVRIAIGSEADSSGVLFLLIIVNRRRRFLRTAK